MYVLPLLTYVRVGLTFDKTYWLIKNKSLDNTPELVAECAEHTSLIGRPFMLLYYIINHLFPTYTIAGIC